MPKQAPWPPSAPQPSAVDWDALVAEVVAAGAEVPELDWAVPGEDAAAQARADVPERQQCSPSCLRRGHLAFSQQPEARSAHAAVWLCAGHGSELTPLRLL